MEAVPQSGSTRQRNKYAYSYCGKFKAGRFCVMEIVLNCTYCSKNVTNTYVEKQHNIHNQIEGEGYGD